MSSRLPAPEQLLLVPMNEMEVAEMIERHIDFVDREGRSVHLPSSFVKHYMKRDDLALPTVTSIAQTPIVLRDGTVLTGRGLHRKYGIVFRVPPELDALMPGRDDCDDAALVEAMRFLTDEWLCDVPTDYAGKCVVIACLLTILERALLPARPAFFITAGKRSSGKTTVLHMISMAGLGLPAAAAAWSTSEEERRKSLFAYLGLGLPLLIWDNITKGSTISCPSIERALTTEFYTDRILGVTDAKTVPAYTVQTFTGNNIGPRGDLASRSLEARLRVDRPDPENREFKHPDPVGWTEANRGRILRAAYSLLVGNPRRVSKEGRPPAETRFKVWWDVVGSAIEHAAGLVAAIEGGGGQRISFRDLFLAGEAKEEETSSVAIVLNMLRTIWPQGCAASDIADRIRGTFGDSSGDYALRAALEAAGNKLMTTISATVVTWQLKKIRDAPVIVGDDTLVLRYYPDKSGHGGEFRVAQAQPAQPAQPLLATREGNDVI